MVSKKGMDLSINVIIVAAIALVVLVVLLAIFLGKTGDWSIKSGKIGDTDLAMMKLKYGDCRPAQSAESNFLTKFGQATTEEAKDMARNEFSMVIDSCKVFTEKGSCSGSCIWK